MTSILESPLLHLALFVASALLASSLSHLLGTTRRRRLPQSQWLQEGHSLESLCQLRPDGSKP